METSAATKDRRKAPRRSYALHFVRPIILAGAALLIYGALAGNLTLTLTGVALEAFAALLAVVLHTSYSRRREQEQEVVCG